MFFSQQHKINTPGANKQSTLIRTNTFRATRFYAQTSTICIVASRGLVETSAGDAEISLDFVEISTGAPEIALGLAETSISATEISFDPIDTSTGVPEITVDLAETSTGALEISLRNEEISTDVPEITLVAIESSIGAAGDSASTPLHTAAVLSVIIHI